MLFNSIEFAFFLPIVFILYWFVLKKNHKAQNVLLLLASYFFYGWWDERFLLLMAFSSCIDFFVGKAMSTSESESKRKLLLGVSISVNLGLLMFFKYYNFFVDSFVDAFTLLGTELSVDRLNIILPVGISFYTFQTLSYSIDIYRRKLEASSNIISFFAFVSFFPQLVAGPIERATKLLPQFNKKRVFDLNLASDGLRQILWGLFKKVVIADNCAVFVNDIFQHHQDYSGSTLLLGAFFFAFQIYGDFSGYSDIAIGTSRLFGFDLMRNFAFPYFSRDIAEFWRRWHISLSTWFRDYLYIPLGGSRGGKWSQIKNTMIIFLVSGFWHGANWTFVVWGFLNALYFLPLLLLNLNRKNTDSVAEGKLLPSIVDLGRMGITFFMTLIAWVFFRAGSVEQAFAVIDGIFSASLFSIPEVLPKKHLALVFIFILMEWLQREKQHALAFDEVKVPRLARLSIYYAIIVVMYWRAGNYQDFIYFQF